jgi:hypothetical protein
MLLVDKIYTSLKGASQGSMNQPSAYLNLFLENAIITRNVQIRPYHQNQHLNSVYLSILTKIAICDSPFYIDGPAQPYLRESLIYTFPQ